MSNNPNLFESLLGTYASFSGTDVVATISVPVFSSDGAATRKIVTIGSLQTITVSTHRDKYPVRALGTIKPRGHTSGPRTIAGSLIFTMFDRDALHDAIMRVGEYRGDQSIQQHMLADEMPSFDVIISMANEYGSAAHTVIQDVTIVDQGHVISIDDILTEQTMSYQATSVKRITPGFIRSGVSSGAFVGVTAGASLDDAVLEAGSASDKGEIAKAIVIEARRMYISIPGNEIIDFWREPIGADYASRFFDLLSIDGEPVSITSDETWDDISNRIKNHPYWSVP